MIRLPLCLVALLLSSSSLAGVIDRHPPVPAKPEHYETMARIAVAAGAFVAKVADTHSMEPTICAEDLLVVRRVRFEDLAVGDVIVFQRWYDLRPELVAHRVTWTNGRWVNTQGDHVREADPKKTTPATFKGRVEFLVNGQTGEIRDLLSGRHGERITLEQALARIGAEQSGEEVSSRATASADDPVDLPPG